MRNFALLLMFHFMVVCASAQNDAETILLKAYNKCLSVQNGYYEMGYYSKAFTAKDTFETKQTCYFTKNAADTIYPSLLHRRVFYKDTCYWEQIYTGNEIIELMPRDSTATITNANEFTNIIKSDIRQMNLYAPLNTINAHPLPDSSDFADTNQTIRVKGEETILGRACYHCEIKTLPYKRGGYQVTYQCMEFWINKDDFIPVQYSWDVDVILGKDTCRQFEKYVLNKYRFDISGNDAQYRPSSIPNYYKLKNYSAKAAKKMLPVGSIPPAWTLTSYKNEQISLADLKGKVVLLDFFYNGCAGCMMALPGLEAMYEKYKDKGLEVIGMDRFDKNNGESFKTMLVKQGLTYNVLWSTKELDLDQYNISYYPTIYILARDGKIIYSADGYTKHLEDELEEIVKKNL